MKHCLTLDCGQGDVEYVRRVDRGACYAYRRKTLLGEQGNQKVAQSRAMLAYMPLLCRAKLDGFSKCGNGRHVFGARAQAHLLTAAEDER